MPRTTKQDLQNRIDSLMKENERLIQDKKDYFIMMQNAELEADRLKEQQTSAEQLQYERDELLREADSLRAELEATKDKLKKARAEARKHEHELNDLKRKYQTARSTVEMDQALIANRDEEIERLKTRLPATTTGVQKINPITEQIQNPKRGRPATITEDQRQNIMALREQRLSIRAIAQAVGVSIGSVQRILDADKATKA